MMAQFELPQQKIRVYKSFMYGNVEKICTYLWNWQRKGQEFEYTQLKKGNILYIQFYDSVVKAYQSKFITVKRVYHSGLV